MKRIAAAIICIVLFVMAPCAALASDTPNTLSENEAMYDSPRDVAISFLNDCAYEMFMYESKGLSNKTVLMLLFAYFNYRWKLFFNEKTNSITI